MNFNLTKEQDRILDYLQARLQENKIRLTKVRLEILRIILTGNHPTFSDIVTRLEQLHNEKPNIMSVYNTINMLLVNRIIYANTFDGKQISYEIKIPQAGHLKCDRCLRVSHLNNLNDFSHDLQKLAMKHHWTCDYFKLEIHGRCAKCQLEFAD